MVDTGRYRLLGRLGVGSMGVVHRALDRLTGQVVALKRVRLPPDFSAEAAEAELLGLAREFATLAGLRHPHIISVLDYGFDAERAPFFTMELLDGARPILDAGRALPLAERATLLVQALEALAYLHRRGILHHDLKPENVLVAGGRVRLLDFGLAVLSNQQRDDDAFGTLQYLAPEVLDGRPYGEAADLYSLGVIAYELLLGCHPFSAASAGAFVDLVFNHAPDLGALAERPALAALLGRLLAKAPEERPASARAAVSTLCAAISLADPGESALVRDSYLQAAAFVGRKGELAQLTAALDEARVGRGGAWLIGGESGVGKSRLLDELRTRALVEGFTVLRGQGVEGGGRSYQLWREPLRLLVLSGALSDLEAGVLKPIVPDIAALLGRAVPDAPPLGGAENVQRLTRVVVDLLGRQKRPMALLLEDLQWADESLPLLHEAARLLVDRPLLVVATYRDDERPRLPDELPGMRVLALARLDDAGIAELSAAMLGESGRRPDVLALLERETEGNTFFMVEVARALAEESGHLGEIGRATLPDQVFTGGVRRLVQRRLRRVPAADYPLLQLAAALGRRVDLAALAAAAPSENLGRWLLNCAEAQVLEVQAEQWRFTHDKLREGVLAAILAEERAALHRAAAAAIERAYAGDPAPHAGRLAEHYRQAGDAGHEGDWARRAGDYAAVTFAHAEAARHYSRALELAEEPRPRFALLLAREEVAEWRGDRATQAADLQTLSELAEALDDDRCRAEVALRRVRQAASVGDLPAAVSSSAEALRLARAVGDPEAEATARLRWGTALFHQNSFPAAREQLTQALDLARSAELHSLEFDCLVQLGGIAEMEGDYGSGNTLILRALELSRELGDRQREARALNDLAVTAHELGDFATEAAYYEEALRLDRLVGRTDDEILVLLNLGTNAQIRGDYDQAGSLYGEGLGLARRIGNRMLEGYALGNLGDLALELGEFEAAERHYARVLDDARRLRLLGEEAYVLIRLSGLALERDEVEAGEAYAQAALELAQEAGLAREQLEAWTILGWIALRRGDFVEAVRAFEIIVDQLGERGESPGAVNAWVGLAAARLAQGRGAEARFYVERILGWLEAHAPIGVYDLTGLYLTCHRVLAAQGDARATAMLEAGRLLLETRAATIGDPERRRSYLERVRSNRELLAALVAR